MRHLDTFILTKHSCIIKFKSRYLHLNSRLFAEYKNTHIFITKQVSHTLSAFPTTRRFHIEGNVIISKSYLVSCVNLVSDAFPVTDLKTSPGAVVLPNAAGH